MRNEWSIAIGIALMLVLMLVAASNRKKRSTAEPKTKATKRATSRGSTPMVAAYYEAIRIRTVDVVPPEAMLDFPRRRSEGVEPQDPHPHGER